MSVSKIASGWLFRDSLNKRRADVIGECTR